MSAEKPFLTIEMRCGCGSQFFVELPQDEGHYMHGELLGLAKVWVTHHGHGPTLEKIVSARTPPEEK